MFRSWTRLFLSGLTALGLSLCLAPSVQALGLSPSIFEEQILPGQSKILELTLINDESQPVRLQAGVQKFLPLGSNGQQRFLPETDVVGVPSWTTVGVTNQVLQPGEKRIVPVQIQVPADAPLGGVYEALFFSGVPTEQASSGAVGVQSRIGALLLLTIGDAQVSRLSLTDWRFTHAASTTDSLSGQVSVTLRNVGTTHVTPRGELVIRNGFGGIVRHIPLNGENSRILPASERTFELPFGIQTEPQSFGGRIRSELIAFGLGGYTISLEGVEGIANVPPLKLYVWPWALLLLAVSVVILLIGAFRVYRRRLIRAMQTSSRSV